VTDSLGTVIDSTENIVEVANPQVTGGPLLSVLSLYPQIKSASAGVVNRNQRDSLMSMLSSPEVASLFPNNLKFLLSADPTVDENRLATSNYEIFLIKTVPGTDTPLIEGDVITDAGQSPDPLSGKIQVTLGMNSKGSADWAQMTGRAAPNKDQIAIALDDAVVSAPSVNSGAITGGRTSITGNFSIAEATDLASILEVGKLPAELNIIQENTVGPSLGRQNISKSFRSLVIGLLIVLVFMVLYYGGAGIVSIVALLANMFFIFGALASIGTVLTIPGFAGIVLTIGMAVDANVIIYERVREELRSGKSLLASIQDGFKNSYSAIIDANVTTILVAIILAWFGLGPIKGFAVVLIIGVLSSLFTAVLLGKLMIDYWTQSRGKSSIATRGFDLGVDFTGGYSYNVQFADDVDVSAQDIREALTAPFGGEPVVKSVDVSNTYQIVTSYQIDNTDKKAHELVLNKLHEGVSSLVGGGLSLDAFKEADIEGATRITASNKVGPTIADDISRDSKYAGIFALLAIFIYIFIRFNKWQFSLGAVQIDQVFIGALLTVIGYSINDTVVVFDRIREYLGIYTNKSTDEVLNLAINSTFSRTIVTSLTTLFVVLVLLLFGGGNIKGFAFAMIVGVIVGTYSSIFVATPIVRDFSKELQAKRRTETKKHFSKAIKA